MSREIAIADFGQALDPAQRYQSHSPIRLRGTIIVGLVAIALTFGGFGGWAALAPLASAVVASGSVKVQSNRKKLQHAEGGVVRDILIKDGDRVAAGDVLIRLDDTYARANHDKLRAKQYAARARTARLICEKSYCPQIEFPPDLLTRGAESPDAKAAMVNEEALFTARRATLEGEVSILNQKIAQLDKQSDGERAQLDAKRRQIVLIKDELDGIQNLFRKGLVEKHRVTALQRDAAQLEGQVGQHIADIARVATEVAEAQLKIIQVRKAFQEDVVDALRETEAELAELETKIAEARHTLDQIEIKAPESGVVVGLDVHTRGGVIARGQTILEIVPADDRLMVEARVAVRDVENLQIGQPSRVLFTAFKQRTTHATEGRLAYISADSLTDERTLQSHYLVRVEVPEQALAAAGLPPLQPGMPADIMITTGERTMLKYLAQPLIDGVSKAWRED